MTNCVGSKSFSSELYHHGIKGQKWGVRRYQNPDGTLTAEGKKRYGTIENFKRHQKIKKVLKTGAFIAGTAIAVYGGYRLSQMIKDGDGKRILDIGKDIIEESIKKPTNSDSIPLSKSPEKGVAEATKVVRDLANEEIRKTSNADIAGASVRNIPNTVKLSKSYSSSRTYTPPSFDMRSALNKSLNDLNDMSGLNDLKNAQEELRRLREMLNGR